MLVGALLLFAVSNLFSHIAKSSAVSNEPHGEVASSPGHDKAHRHGNHRKRANAPQTLLQTEMRKGHTDGGIFRVAEVSIPLQMSQVAAEGMMPMFDWHHAWQEAVRSGAAGLQTGVLQVLCFMWLRTIMNHQYYHGGSAVNTVRELWREGGIVRLYRGLTWALICTPAARFGDTFANAGVIALLGGAALPSSAGTVGYGAHTRTLATTALATTVAVLWRITIIAPLDTFKTATQVQGLEANRILMARVERAGVTQLWSGTIAGFCAHYLGCYPWWAMRNTLEDLWAEPAGGLAWVLRTTMIGALASAASDLVSNAPRVLKTIRQCHPDPNVGYFAASSGVLKVDGASSLLTRGLAARILANVIQGSFFSVVWSILQHYHT